MIGTLAQTTARRFHWVFAAFVVLTLAYPLALMPVAFGDQFTEIVRTLDSSLLETIRFYLTEAKVYFRPMEYVWRELLLSLFGQRLFSYNLFGILLLAASALLFLLHCRVASARDAVAAAIALSALFGHHALAGSLELNLVITNLVIFLALVAALLVLRSNGGPLAAASALLLSVAALLTKELGLVVPILLVAGWLFGLPGVRRPTAVAICAFTLVYLGFRLYAVLWLGEIAAPTYDAAGSLSVYLTNVAATLFNIVLSEPKSGDFGRLGSGLALAVARPWKLAQLAAPLLTFGLIAYVAASRRLWRPESEPALRPWLLLLLVALAASALLGFFRPKDSSGVTALPAMAAVLFLCLRRVMDDIEDPALPRARRLLLAVLLIALSAAWTYRIPSNAFFLRDLSASIRMDWVENYGSYESRYGADHGHHLRTFRDHALGTPVPPDDPSARLLRGLFGNRNSIAR